MKYAITVKYIVDDTEAMESGLWEAANEYITTYLNDMPEIEELTVHLSGSHLELCSDGIEEHLVWEDGWLPYEGSRTEREALVQKAYAKVELALAELRELA